MEFVPGLAIATLDAALALVRRIDMPQFKILIDAMHLHRSGGDAAAVATIDPALIGYAQLCDVPMRPATPDYMREASLDRRAPGDGDLPHAALVAALPRDIAIGQEVPMLAAAQAGVRPIDRLRPAVAAARRLIKCQGDDAC